MTQVFRGFIPIFASIAITLLVFGAMIASLSEGQIISPPAPTQFPTLPPPNLTPISQIQSPVVSTNTSTALPPTQTACPPPAGWQVYTVQAGETIAELALQFGIPVQELLAANCLSSEITIAGAQLFVPPVITYTPSIVPTLSLTISPTTTRCLPPRGWVKYTVKPGDTLTRLSGLYRVSVWELRRANCLTSDFIRAGQRLYVPNVATSTFTSVPEEPQPTQPILPTATNTSLPTSTNTSPPPTPQPSPTPSGTFTNTPTSLPTATNTPEPSLTNSPEPTLTETIATP
jgi:LysM repeat protein